MSRLVTPPNSTEGILRISSNYVNNELSSHVSQQYSNRSSRTSSFLRVVTKKYLSSFKTQEASLWDRFFIRIIVFLTILMIWSGIFIIIPFGLLALFGYYVGESIYDLYTSFKKLFVKKKKSD